MEITQEEFEEYRGMRHMLMRIAPCITCKKWKQDCLEGCMLYTVLPRSWEFDKDAVIINTIGGVERVDVRQKDEVAELKAKVDALEKSLFKAHNEVETELPYETR